MHALLATGFACCLAAIPQPAPTHPAADGPLAGPAAREAAAKPTLLHREFDGSLRRLDEPAEEAALRLISLSPDEQAKIDTVLAARAAIIDAVVANNIPLLLRVQGLKDAQSRQGAMESLRELSEKLRPLRERGRLRDEIAGALSDEHAKQFAALVDEYQKAVREEAAASAGPDARPRQVMAREALLAIGQEVRRSYDRVIGSRKGKLDEVIQTLSLPPEQETKVRNLATDYFQKTLGQPTPAQRREFVKSLMQELTPEQRRTLASAMYNARGG